jgi:hypothetical protein
MTPTSRRKSRLQLFLLAACFFLPVLIALAMQTPMFHWQPAATKNFGELIQPVVPLVDLLPTPVQTQSGLTGDGTWTLLWLPKVPCDANCLARIEALRAVKQIQGRHLDRVKLALVAEAGVPLGADWNVYRLSPTQRRTLAQALGLENTAEGLVMLDPFGNAMLRYGEGFDATMLRKDLSKMLKTSQAGRVEPN